MRGKAAVGIDLVRGKRQYRALDRGREVAFQRGEEEPDVPRHLLDVCVARDDNEQRLVAPRRGSRARLARGCRRDEERFR